MKGKPVVPRKRANRDVEDAVSCYLREAGAQRTMHFIDALTGAYIHVGAHPATGSPRYANELNLPGLRLWALARYPYLVFYVERTDHIDVWRVLHSQRDVPAWMRDVDG